VAVLVVALVAMSLYAKRSLQGRYADAVNGATQQFTQKDAQYEPYYVNSTVTTRTGAGDIEDTALGGAVNRTYNETSNSAIYKKDQAAVPANE
jgi:adenylylsulfate kinase-like enzyme